MKKKVTSVLLAALLLSSAAAMFSCAESEPTDGNNGTDVSAPGAETEAAPAEETETKEVRPDLPDDLSFGGASFTFGVVDNPNARNFLVMEELTGEVLNDAQFTVMEEAQEALDVAISQYVITTGYPAASSLTPLIAAGDDTVQVANVFCVDAVTLLSGSNILGYENVPYIDLDKPWWDQSVNSELLLGDMRYAAIGDLSISTHDLTYILLFNKDLIPQYNLDSPYDLVDNGSWTIDTMASMMETATMDLNGDGQWTRDDAYGYAAHSKMVLPSFWIGAGFQTIALDDEGVPQINIGTEAFVSLFEKIFAITYDNHAKYNGADRDLGQDVPTTSCELFQEGKVLFIDCSLFWVSALRDMEMDFGIIPYPKNDETQANYHARVSYYMPPVLPATNRDFSLVGAVLEMTNYLAKKEVTPAYYDKALKGKYSRDEESVQMLDLIFANRVIDLGDTLFCADVRDGFMYSLYANDNRDLISTYERQSKALQKKIEQIIKTVGGGE